MLSLAVVALILDITVSMIGVVSDVTFCRGDEIDVLLDDVGHLTAR